MIYNFNVIELISLQSYVFFLKTTSFLKKIFKALLRPNHFVTICKTTCCKKGSIIIQVTMQQI